MNLYLAAAAAVGLFPDSGGSRCWSKEAAGEKGSGSGGDEEEAEEPGEGEAERAPEVTDGGKWRAELYLLQCFWCFYLLPMRIKKKTSPDFKI